MCSTHTAAPHACANVDKSLLVIWRCASKSLASQVETIKMPVNMSSSIAASCPVVALYQ